MNRYADDLAAVLEALIQRRRSGQCGYANAQG